MSGYTSLVNIWTSRPDLQKAFPKGTSAGTPDNNNLNNWWNQYGVNEYPGVTLVPPGDNRIQNPQTLTAEAQQQTQNQGNQTDTNTTDTTNTDTTDTTYDTGNDDLNNILKSISDVLTSITDSGKIVNPKIDITPEIAQGFIDQAESELNPYYQSQFSAIKDDLKIDFNYLTEQYKQSVKSNEATFKQNLETQRESEAGAGTIFSGGRKTREQELADATQRNIESLGTTAGYQANKIGTSAERNIGSLNLGELSFPSYTPYNVSTKSQGGFTPIGERNLWNPIGGITGSMEREKIEKKRSYSDLLKSNWLAEQSV